MHYQPIVVAPKYTVAEALEAGNMSEKKFILSWTTSKKDEEVREYIKNNSELPFPAKTGIVGLGDPRILDCEQYRDSLRLQFRCHETGLQLKTATMVFPPTKPDEDEGGYDLFSSDWDMLCMGLEEERPVGYEAKVEVRLQLLDKENDEPVFESNTPTLELRQLLGL